MLALAVDTESALARETGHPWPAGAEGTDRWTDARAPGRVGDYDLVEEIGQGGMGTVYKARHRTLQRWVALKRLRLERWDQPDSVLRFQIETEAVARLDHPNIVPLHEAGESNGLHYFTMKLVPGGSLAAALAQPAAGQLRERVECLLKVARAVHYAHQRGVIHRDLKPANILLDERGEPMITDFGLARILERDAEITQTHTILGSPNFIAPEQAAGRSSSISTGVDIYSLGAILYQVLTGEPPFRAATALETMRMVMEEPPARPRSLNAGVDRDLETVCLKCLEKEPERRYASASELADDLERWLEGLPLKTRSVTPPELLWRWCKRNPALSAACVTALVLLVTLAVGTSLAAFRIARANARAERLLTQMQLAQAERLMQTGQSADGLALLAHVARQLPHDSAIGRRLFSALAHRSYALQAYAPLKHGAPLLAVFASPTNDLLLTVGNDGILRRWRLSTGEFLVKLAVPGVPLLDAHFSENGAWLAVVTAAHAVELWRVADEPGRQLVLQDERIAGAGHVSLDPRGERMVVVNRSSHVASLWDPRTGEFLRELTHETTISGRTAFNQSGDRLAVGLGDGRVAVWDVGAGQQLPVEFRHQRYIMGVAFSHDGRLLASASDDQTAKVWDLETGQALPLDFRHRNEVGAVAFSADDRFLLSSSLDNSARVWSLETGRLAFEPLAHDDGVRALLPLEGNREIITAAHGGKVHRWRLISPMYSANELALAAPAYAVAFSRDGRTIVTGADDGTIQAWTSASGAAAAPARVHGAPINHLEVSPNNQLIAASGFASEARLWKLDADQYLKLAHGDWVRSARFDATGSRVVTASHDGTAQVWNARDGTPLGPPLRHDDHVYDAHFSPDGRWVATASRDKTARIFESSSGRTAAILRHHSWVVTARFSPDGKRIVTASYDRRGRIWHLLPGGGIDRRHAPILLPHKGQVVHAEFSPDGKSVATASFDHTARLWDAANGEPAPFVFEHNDPVNQAVFSPDGRLVLTCSRDGSARVWDAGSGRPLTESLLQSGDVVQARFSPDGGLVAAVSCSHPVAKTWRLRNVTAEEQMSLSDLASLVSRRRLNSLGYIETIPETDLATITRSLGRSTGTLPIVDWFMRTVHAGN